MSRVTVQVEIDIPEGMEVAGATCCDIHQPNVYQTMVGEIRVQLKEGWKPPSWLKPGWIAMDSDGEWYWYSHEPERYKEAWDDGGNPRGKAVWLSHNSSWIAPACDEWLKSLRKV